MVSSKIPLELSSGDLDLKIMPIRIEHKLKEIFISSNLVNKENGIISFHIKEGFPLALHIESFLVFLITCKHNVVNKIKIPIEYMCNWRIMGGMREGAFKSKSGMDTRYSDTFHGSNSAIYYPPRNGFEKTIKTKKIQIGLKINPVFIDGQKKGPIAKESSKLGTSNMIVSSSGWNSEYLLEMFLGKLAGFRNRNSYEVKLYCKGIGDQEQYEDVWKSVHIQTKSESRNYFYSSMQILDDANKICYTCDTEVERCNICNLKLNLILGLNRCHEKIRINLESERFFTSEYVSLTNNLFDIANSYEAPGVDDDVPLFEVANDTKSIFRFRVWNCPIPKIFELVWSSTGGLFPCGKNGNSVIFQSPQEKELRKSPITLSISYIIPSSSSLILDESLKLLDRRKILLMRRMVFGG